ncbi:60S ribosomal protein L7 [Plasmodium gonderi]|uniref:60S ribosomal protein L7 n=1 Tax=Plasmodium gonderi TaxID=77519 RepID=A0A1Y1JJ76_PLAGO|nr:60S ribosomal protein L7 [Plasmodium gonderi]GAW81708.1 60S ribosomal protein L7 [Plasmodium gonderi]
MSKKKIKNKQPLQKNGTNNSKRKKHVKFRRIKKVQFKDEKKVIVSNEIKKKKVKIHGKKKLNTPYQKKEYKKIRMDQANEYINLQKELASHKFDEPRCCIFAIRNNINCVASAPMEVLQKLRLMENFYGVLLVNNEINMKNLFLVKRYVCYGYIQKYNLYNLLEKKLFLKDGNEIKRCQSNKIIEKLFSKDGIYSFPAFCEYIFECKNNADQITKEHIIPFNFSYLKSDITFDFLQFKNELAGFVKDNEINEILEKII